MAQIHDQIEKLKTKRPSEWQSIPDIQLYMDQILSYMTRQLSDPGISKPLTAAMINNYIKLGLLPRAEKKLYSKEHIALLTAICILKQVMTTKDIGVLLLETGARNEAETFYEKLCRSLDKELTASLATLSEDMDRDSMALAALNLAVAAYSRQLACMCIVELLRGDGELPKNNEKTTKKQRKIDDKNELEE